MNAHVQERIESSRAGQIALSLFIAATLFAVVVTNLPESLLRREVSKVTQHYLEATGLYQTWRVFAPNPRQTSLRLEARVRYDDGAVAVWRPPAGSDLVGAYWDYRWRKWLENVTQDANRKVLWRPTALFVARQMRRSGQSPARITLVRRWQDLSPPGAPASERGSWRSYAFFTLAL